MDNNITIWIILWRGCTYAPCIFTLLRLMKWIHCYVRKWCLWVCWPINDKDNNTIHGTTQNSHIDCPSHNSPDYTLQNRIALLFKTNHHRDRKYLGQDALYSLTERAHIIFDQASGHGRDSQPASRTAEQKEAIYYDCIGQIWYCSMEGDKG